MMNRKWNPFGKAVVLLLLGAGLALSAACGAAEEKKAATAQPAGAGAATKPADTQSSAADANGMVDLAAELKLPAAAFKETPKDLKSSNLEPPRKGPRPKFLVPAGCKNVAIKKAVTSSDKEPIIGELKCITDGSKEATEGSYVELAPGTQWVQLDLGESYKTCAVVIWHYHGAARVYYDVVVQISDDADFIEKTTVYNNDHDNSSGLGVGKEKEYIETFEGRIIDGKGAKGRYVRLYSKGNTSDDQNHYTEIEVYALPAK